MKTLRAIRDYGRLLIHGYILRDVWAKAILTHIRFNYLASITLNLEDCDVRK